MGGIYEETVSWAALMMIEPHYGEWQSCLCLKVISLKANRKVTQRPQIILIYH